MGGEIITCPKCGTVYHSILDSCWYCKGSRVLPTVSQNETDEEKWGRHFVGRWNVEPEAPHIEESSIMVYSREPFTREEMWQGEANIEKMLYELRRTTQKFGRIKEPTVLVAAGTEAYCTLRNVDLPRSVHLVRDPSLEPDMVRIGKVRENGVL